MSEPATETQTQTPPVTQTTVAPQQQVPPQQQQQQAASLYVGDLEPNATESILFEVFKKVGPVASIRVCRDNSTRRSLGYAYVNYHRVEDAERALDTLNYTPITGGKACRIMWSQRNPSLRKSGVGNIYIKNLAESITSADLYDTFSQFGTILSCKVETDENGKSKGFGYVHFEDVKAAEEAIEQVNGIEIEGKEVYVQHFVSSKQRIPGGATKFTNVYVKNIPLDMDEVGLQKLFSKFGEITSVYLPPSNNSAEEEDQKGDEQKTTTGDEKNRGFAFVNFKEFDSAAKAVDELHGSEFKDKKLYVSRAQKKSERLQFLRKQFEERKLKYQDSNLYIKNLDDLIDDEKLKEVFDSYGTIISAKVMRDENKASKGFGFVCFSSPEEAHKAIQELNGRMLFNKPLYVALAQRKEIRVAQLQAQYAHRHGAKMIPNPMAFGPMPNQAGYPFVRGANAPNQQYLGYPQMMPPNQQRRWPQQPNPNTRGPNPSNPQQQPPYPAGTGYQKKTDPNVAQPSASSDPNNLSNVISSLSNLSEEDRKRTIGDHLYQKIDAFFKMNPNIGYNDAGKITGMLLESLDEQELINLAEDPNELSKRIKEAIDVLLDHQN